MADFQILSVVGAGINFYATKVIVKQCDICLRLLIGIYEIERKKIVNVNFHLFQS